MLHIEPSVVALLGAGLLVLISGARSHHYLANVEWETLLFSAGLFIMIGALVRKGVVITAITVAVAAPYLWLRYFVLA